MLLQPPSRVGSPFRRKDTSRRTHTVRATPRPGSPAAESAAAPAEHAPHQRLAHPSVGARESSDPTARHAPFPHLRMLTPRNPVPTANGGDPRAKAVHGPDGHHPFERNHGQWSTAVEVEQLWWRQLAQTSPKAAVVRWELLAPILWNACYDRVKNFTISLHGSWQVLVAPAQSKMRARNRN